MSSPESSIWYQMCYLSSKPIEAGIKAQAHQLLFPDFRETPRRSFFGGSDKIIDFLLPRNLHQSSSYYPVVSGGLSALTVHISRVRRCDWTIIRIMKARRTIQREFVPEKRRSSSLGLISG